MRYIKKYSKYIKEASATVESPTPTKPKPPKPPTKPDNLKGVTKSKTVTEMDVVNRFIEEMHKKGESIKKYM